jgi:hypothetical protein
VKNIQKNNKIYKKERKNNWKSFFLRAHKFVKMIGGEKVLVFGLCMASLTIIACQGTAQNPDSDFNRFDILSPNQNRIGHGVYEVSGFFPNFIAIL